VVHNLLVTIDPAVLVLGGPLGGLSGFVDAALESLKLLRGASTSHRAVVRPCAFGASAGAVGAAASVLNELLHPVAHAPARPGARAVAS
jgi:predicted NBD/HSP70 family sugar kinase